MKTAPIRINTQTFSIEGDTIVLFSLLSLWLIILKSDEYVPVLKHLKLDRFYFWDDESLNLKQTMYLNARNFESDNKISA